MLSTNIKGSFILLLCIIQSPKQGCHNKKNVVSSSILNFQALYIPSCPASASATQVNKANSLSTVARALCNYNDVLGLCYHSLSRVTISNFLSFVPKFLVSSLQ